MHSNNRERPMSQMGHKRPIARVTQRLFLPRKRPSHCVALSDAMGHKATYAVQQEAINKSCLDVLNR